MALINRRRRRGSRRRHLSLGMTDPPIEIREATYVEATDNNRRSLVGRVLSPRKQDLYSVMEKLPETWQVSDSKLQGRDIGGGKFQFVFEDERDLKYVLGCGPWTYNGWLVVMQRWEDEPFPDLFLKWVPIWVRIHGIPIRYLCEGTIREIASSLGEVIDVVSVSGRPIVDLRYSRVLVDIPVDTRLRFKKKVRFESGETAIVSFRYEDVDCDTLGFKYCRNCGALDHLTNACDDGQDDGDHGEDDDNDNDNGDGEDDDNDNGDGEDDENGDGEDDDDDNSLSPPRLESSSNDSVGYDQSNRERFVSKRKFNETLGRNPTITKTRRIELD